MNSDMNIENGKQSDKFDVEDKKDKNLSDKFEIDTVLFNEEQVTRIKEYIEILDRNHQKIIEKMENKIKGQSEENKNKINKLEEKIIIIQGEKEKKCSEMENKIRELIKERKDFEILANKKENELHALVEEIKNANRYLNDTNRSQRNDYEMKIRTLEVANNTTERENNEKHKKEMEITSKQIKDNEKYIEDLQTQIKSLNNNIEDLKGEYNRQSVGYRMEINELEDNLVERNKNIEEMKHELETVKKNYEEEIKKKVTQYNKEKAELENKNLLLANEVKYIEYNLKEKDGAIQLLHRQLRDIDLNKINEENILSSMRSIQNSFTENFNYINNGITDVMTHLQRQEESSIKNYVHRIKSIFDMKTMITIFVVLLSLIIIKH